MPSFSSLVAAWSIVGSLYMASAAPTSGSVVFEKLRGVPENWEVVGPADPSLKQLFRIALKSPNQGHFEQTLLAISTPDHPSYGQHLSHPQLKAMLRPRAEATDSVLSWLSAAGIAQIEDDGDFINFNANYSQAENLLNAKFYEYSNKINGAHAIRTLEYSVPQNLQKEVEMIQPTTRFGQIRALRSPIHEWHAIGKAIGQPRIANGENQTADAVSCNNSITPKCLRDLYNIKNFNADSTNGNKLGITGFLEEYGNYKDMATFLAEYAPEAIKANFTYELINGGKNVQQNNPSDSIEANLDVQYAISLASPVSSIFYSTGGRGPLVPDLDQPSQADNQNEPYLDFLTYILKLPQDKLPQTLTTSYGEDEQSLPESYTTTVCNMFGQLGARGVSILFSSGDTGPGSGCQTNDGKNTTRFQPIFPAACPWVTAVGGTVHIAPEEAVGFSSGGFSERFPRPQWQEEAVSDFLKINGDKWAGLFNPAGRGFPDVAAQGQNFHVVDKGKEILVGGTSASAPTFAGVVSLLNSARLSAKQPPLGFLNPWIYSTAYKGLTDIVDGTSKGCTGRDIYSGLPAPYIPGAGWAAMPGWDPVTGWGTPDFGKLLKLSAVGGRSAETE